MKPYEFCKYALYSLWTVTEYAVCNLVEHNSEKFPASKVYNFHLIRKHRLSNPVGSIKIVKQAKNVFCEDTIMNMADDVHLLIISQSLTLTDMTIVLPYLDVS